MIVRGFKSVLWVGAVGSAALSCYMVSLRVATERSDLARVEHQIVDAKRDIRSLETELGTRGRLAQLEDWNNNVLALSAPSSGQYVKDAYTLAQLPTHGATVEDRTGAVRMAALDTGPAASVAEAAPAKSRPAAKVAPALKPAKVAPPAPDAVPLPRVVEAVAPARRNADPIRRASFDIPGTPAAPAPAKAKPAKAKAVVADADPKPGSAPKGAAAKKAKTPPKGDETASAAPHRAPRTAEADAKTPARPGKAKPHAAAKLARADAAPHIQASGHRGGAQ
jgi:hypothetical protein